MEPFIKGEQVIAHSSDVREMDENLVVASVGKKWITCRFVSSNGELFSSDEKFDATTRESSRRRCYKLYHSKEEYLEEERLKDLKLKLKLEFEHSLWSLSLDELLLFNEIHKTGVDEWKRINLKSDK